jgi:uncharacterized membrane protein (UPF0127 family)
MNRRQMLALLATLPIAAHARGAHAQEDEPKGPQPELPKETLTIVSHDGKKHVFHVEVARTLEQQTVGLMFRKQVPADGGMLFDWGTVKESQMWMKNTLAPLDMVFINPDGTIRHIAENTVPESLAVIDSHGPVRATLELQGGITAKLDIRVGDKVLAPIFGDAG